MKPCLRIGLAAVGIAFRAGAGVVYYVDSAGGDDAADGAAPARAWRTLDRVNAADLRPGDRVLFRRGGEWRGQLIPRSGAPDAPVTYGAFGDGPKPKLLGSLPANRPEDWMAAGPGLWRTAPVSYAPAGPSVALPPRRWTLHTEGGSRVARSPDDLRLTCHAAGSAPHHVQLHAAGLAIESGRWYRLSFRLRAASVAAPFPVALMRRSAPHTSYAPPATVDPARSPTAVVFRARASDPSARITLFLGAALAAGAEVEASEFAFEEVRPDRDGELDVDVGNIIFDGGARCGVKRWSADALTNDGDYHYDAASRSVLLRMGAAPPERHRSIELALRRHIVDQSGCSWVTYEDLALAYGAAHGIGGGSTRGITVRRCDISYIGGGHQHTRPDGRPVRFGNGIEFWSGARDCRVEDCRIWEIYDAALTNQGAGTNTQENIVYRGNVIWNSEYSFEYWNRDGESVTRDIRFEHNTCVDAGSGWGHGQRPDRNGQHLMFFNNTARTERFVIRRNVFCRSTESLVRLHGRDWTAALTLDENVWHQPEGAGAWWGTNRVPAAALAGFLHGLGFDRASRFAAPAFFDEAARDYRSRPGSPADGYGAPAP